MAGLEMAKYMEVWRVTCRTNSQLVVGKMNGDFQVKDDHLLQYFHRASALAKDFEKIEIWHIPREDNSRVDKLSKLNNGKENGLLTTIIRQVLLQPSVECLATTMAWLDGWRVGGRRFRS